MRVARRQRRLPVVSFPTTTTFPTRTIYKRRRVILSAARLLEIRTLHAARSNRRGYVPSFSPPFVSIETIGRYFISSFSRFCFKSWSTRRHRWERVRCTKTKKSRTYLLRTDGYSSLFGQNNERERIEFQRNDKWLYFVIRFWIKFQYESIPFVHSTVFSRILGRFFQVCSKFSCLTKETIFFFFFFA